MSWGLWKTYLTEAPENLFWPARISSVGGVPAGFPVGLVARVLVDACCISKEAVTPMSLSTGVPQPFLLSSGSQKGNGFVSVRKRSTPSAFPLIAAVLPLTL